MGSALALTPISFRTPSTKRVSAHSRNFDFRNFLQDSSLIKEVSAFLVRVEIHQAVHRPGGFKTRPKIRRVFAVDVGAALGYGCDPGVLIFSEVPAGFHDRAR